MKLRVESTSVEIHTRAGADLFIEEFSGVKVVRLDEDIDYFQDLKLILAYHGMYELHSYEGVIDYIDDALRSYYARYRCEDREEFRARCCLDCYQILDGAISAFINVLSHKYASRLYAIRTKEGSYPFKWIREKRLETKLKIDDTEVILSGRIDRYKLLTPFTCIVADYKTKSLPEMDSSMRIQMDGYAYLIKQSLGIDCVMSRIDFPVLDFQEYYQPDPWACVQAATTPIVQIQ